MQRLMHVSDEMYKKRQGWKTVGGRLRTVGKDRLERPIEPTTHAPFLQSASGSNVERSSGMVYENAARRVRNDLHDNRRPSSRSSRATPRDDRQTAFTTPESLVSWLTKLHQAAVARSPQRSSALLSPPRCQGDQLADNNRLRGQPP